MNKIFKNEYLFSMITKVVVVMISLVQQIIIARYLGADIKGEASYVQNLIGIFSIIIVLGLHHSYPLFRRSESFNEKKRNEFLTGTILLFTLYIAISLIICITIRLNEGVKIALILSPFVGYGNVISYVYLIEKPNRRNADLLIFTIIDFVFYIAIILAFKPDIYIGISLLYFIEIVKCLWFTFKLKYRMIVNIEILSILKDQVIIGILPMLSLLLTNLNYKLDVIMLSNAHNITKADVGAYSVAIAIAEKALLLPDALKEILISKLSKGKNYEEVARVNRLAVFLTLITATCIFLLCPFVVHVLFGEEYSGAIGLIRITTFGTAFMVIFKMVGSYNIINNKQLTNLIFLSVSVAINYFCNALMIPIFGTYGAAYATIIGFFVCGMLFTVYFCKTEKVPVWNFIVVNKEDINYIKGILKK